jgi:Uma2 family endonuclease
MATLLKLGPTDAGRVLTLEEFMSGDYEEGYRYELIDGRLYVSPQPNVPGALVEDWILDKLKEYARAHPDVLKRVIGKARVFVHARKKTTNPEPDATAYHDFPVDAPFQEIRWEELNPILVVEVVSEDDPNKDLVRNAKLYLQVPSIREYWVLDPREDPEHPSLRMHRRRGNRWVIRDFAGGSTYTTKLLPGFSLVLDARS